MRIFRRGWLLPRQLCKNCRTLGINESEVAGHPGQIKTFEPSGIFAASLAECLTIQLKDLNRFDPYMEILVTHLDWVAERRFKDFKN